jgi:hypothetical protein
MSDISELFDRDPLSLTDQDIAKIVAKMREHQAQFELGVVAKPAPKPKSPKTSNLLKDLGL